MKVKSIFVNLPVENIETTRKFWTKLGFSFNEQFSDANTLCLILKEGLIYLMLFRNNNFSTFQNRPKQHNETMKALTAIEVDSPQKVDRIVSLAIENGGSRFRESYENGWMYYDGFADPDGHHWEVICTNPKELLLLA